MRWLADLRPALRLLGRSPVFTLTSVLSLAAGLAVPSAVMSLADALLAPAPGVRDAGRLPARRAAATDPATALRAE